MMQKVKLFKGVESEMEELENDVNKWIEASGCRVISIVGNIAPQTRDPNSMESFPVSDILVVVTYEASNE
ncbi:MAG: hypothetical protein Aurels2KO_18780 [Aureliella sp.]